MWTIEYQTEDGEWRTIGAARHRKAAVKSATTAAGIMERPVRIIVITRQGLHSSVYGRYVTGVLRKTRT